MMKRIFLILSLVLISLSASARVWHVSDKNGDVNNKGTQQSPFKTISKASRFALAGDTILIQGGTYREWVSPENSGFSDLKRIVYMATDGAEVWLKGSEQVTGWVKQSSGAWMCEVDNLIFGDFNPFDINIQGDWLLSGFKLHLGEVYLNSKPLVEQLSLEELEKSENGWFAKVENDKTVIYAQFGRKNPNKELAEINVRPTCFFPKSQGMNYITVKGINITQAATQWSAPTSEQIGIIGPNWSKGWVIEDCEISYSKCVGVCLGKDRGTGHNFHTLYKGDDNYNKEGFTREIESIISAVNKGWSKESVGSHVIRNNKIHNCGQAGIVGHLGCVFSVIEHNEIYNNNTVNDPYFRGHECAGIKLHAAIDVVIKDNFIYNSVMGLWLDWQAQGTHVVGNVFADNPLRDVFVEVSHGPTLIYNNIMLSKTALQVNAQGIAYFNNLFAGAVNVISSSIRYTPYHMPHSTQLMGFINNNGGDVRFYNNVFLIQHKHKKTVNNGLAGYNEYPEPKAKDTFKGLKNTSHFLGAKLPVWTSSNVYLTEGQPYVNEKNHVVLEQTCNELFLEKRKDGYYLKNLIDLDLLKANKGIAVNTKMLGVTINSQQEFENPDGSAFSLTTDLYGQPRDVSAPTPGPFEKTSEQAVWKY